MKVNNREKGIFLLELIVAAAIMATIFLFVGRAYGVSKNSLKRATAFLKATLLWEEKMWELEEKEEIRQGEDCGDFSGQSYSWKINAQNLGDSGLNLVTLEVFRKEQRNPENFSATTYLKDIP